MVSGGLNRMKVKVLVAQLCPTLCDPMDCSLPGSFVHGILQTRILERVAILFPRGSSRPRDWTWISCIAGRFFTIRAKLVKMKVAQSCPTLCYPVEYSPPGSFVHGIFQARILEWVAISFSRGSSQPRDQTQVSCISGRFFTTWATREASYFKRLSMYLDHGKFQ